MADTWRKCGILRCMTHHAPFHVGSLESRGIYTRYFVQIRQRTFGFDQLSVFQFSLTCYLILKDGNRCEALLLAGSSCSLLRSSRT
ncbi:hypothetical protein NPIL_97781 [Nephila pilipes]|uniref:Uncharacterized protein n=1 Tax=Nephila pilipes TaxID=299642 RepID=A0A8X6T4L9_NEPPI|nr:hypothetical protein NPIL_97781 [Nephila pilipes]